MSEIRARQGAQVLASGAVAVLPAFAVAALFVFGQTSSLAQPATLAALAAIAAVAYSLQAWSELDDADGAGGTTFDATIVVALVALDTGGPLPALAVWLIPDFIHRVILRRAPVVTAGLALNVTSYAMALLIAGAMLSWPTGSPAGELADLFAAGLVMAVVNFAIAPYAFAVLFKGPADRRHLRADFARAIPATLGMTAIAAATAVAVDTYSIVALALLSAAVVLPEIGLRRVAAVLEPPAPAPTRDSRYVATGELLEAVTVQVEALVQASSSSRHRPLGDDLHADLAEALVALRRVANRQGLPTPAYEGTEATIEILETLAGRARLLRPLPDRPETEVLDPHSRHR